MFMYINIFLASCLHFYPVKSKAFFLQYRNVFSSEFIKFCGIPPQILHKRKNHETPNFFLPNESALIIVNRKIFPDENVFRYNVNSHHRYIFFSFLYLLAHSFKIWKQAYFYIHFSNENFFVTLIRMQKNSYIKTGNAKNVPYKNIVIYRHF